MTEPTPTSPAEPARVAPEKAEPTPPSAREGEPTPPSAPNLVARGRSAGSGPGSNGHARQSGRESRYWVPLSIRGTPRSPGCCSVDFAGAAGPYRHGIPHPPGTAGEGTPNGAGEPSQCKTGGSGATGPTGPTGKPGSGVYQQPGPRGRGRSPGRPHVCGSHRGEFPSVARWNGLGDPVDSELAKMRAEVRKLPPVYVVGTDRPDSRGTLALTLQEVPAQATGGPETLAKQLRSQPVHTDQLGSHLENRQAIALLRVSAG